MILVISYPEDEHSQAVIRHLQAGRCEVCLLDLSDLPDRAMVTLDYAAPCSPAIVLNRPDQQPIRLDRAKSVWWRRPQSPNPAAVTDPNVRLFTGSEWSECLNGIWQLIPARWMNPPASDEVAARKAFQLRVAAEVGLGVPRTLITSDPEQAAAFIDLLGIGNVIFKTFSATQAIWRETRLVRQEERGMLESVRLAPTIFQEYIAGVDLRITAVGDQLFPAAIHAAGTDYPVDFRMSLGQAHTEPVNLPALLEDKLRALLARLGLAYGAIDMRLAPNGEYVFFEVNTAGEFLFIEERTGQPISYAIAEWLAKSV